MLENKTTTSCKTSFAKKHIFQKQLRIFFFKYFDYYKMYEKILFLVYNIISDVPKTTFYVSFKYILFNKKIFRRKDWTEQNRVYEYIYP